MLIHLPGETAEEETKREIGTIGKNPGVRRRRHNMDKREDQRLPGEAVEEARVGGGEKVW